MKKILIILALFLINSCIYTSYDRSYGTKDIKEESFRKEVVNKNMQEVISQNKPEFIIKDDSKTTLNYHYVDSRAAIPAYIPVVSMFYSMFNNFYSDETYVSYDNYLTINYDKNGNFIDMKYDVSGKKTYDYFSSLPTKSSHPSVAAPLDEKYYTGSQFRFSVGG